MQMVYIVEDDPHIQSLLMATLKTGGFSARAFANAEDFYAALEEQMPALVLLDIMLPGEDGLKTLERLRAKPFYQKLPVILLTAKSEEFDKVKGLDLGADDYITKPFGVLELIARVRTALRHAEQNAAMQEKVNYKDIVIDQGSKDVYKAGEPVHLTYKEYEVLLLLYINQGTVVSRDQLLNSIWGYDYDGETRTVDVHINSIRQKLGDHAETPRYIATVRGYGYKLLKDEK